MDAERWNHVDTLLQSALDFPAEERDVFLRNACGGDAQLEDEVRSLIGAHNRADSFLGGPAIDRAGGPKGPPYMADLKVRPTFRT